MPSLPYKPGAVVMLHRDLGPSAPPVGSSGVVLLADPDELTVEFPRVTTQRKLWRLRPADLELPPKRRRRPDATTCSNGHDLTAPDALFFGRGAAPHGACRACRRAAGRRFLAELKGRAITPKVLP